MRTVILDLETDGLTDQKVIHCAVTLDYETGETREWKDVHKSIPEFRQYLLAFDRWAGHNIIGFDLPVLHHFGMDGDHEACVDTLVLSQLTDFTREKGHSLESYGPEAGVVKTGLDITEWGVYDPRMLDRCHSDVLITKHLLDKFQPYLQSARWAAAIRTEHDSAWYCNELHSSGFAFDVDRARNLREKINHEVQELEGEFQRLFPCRSSLVKVITPRLTKHGTLNKSDFRWVTDGDLTSYAADAPFSRIKFEPFNPGSTVQRIDRLWEAGWRPTERTKGYKEFLRSLPRAKRGPKPELTVEQTEKKTHYEKYGWTCDEKNLATLPADAPGAIQKFVRWLLLSSRVRRLDEWLGCVHEDGRIHGKFRSLGAWTHRMAHSDPNMGNTPKFDAKQPEKTPYSDVMRALWVSERDHYLVGVDAESIQLRVLAHYLDDEEFTHAIVQGRKEDQTDPHSVNQRALGPPCKSRDDAKTFIYAWLLGAGIGKVAEILKCSKQDAQQANENFIRRYAGLAKLKNNQIPLDAHRGYFEGFDGRFVRIPGDVGQRMHLALAGYLQNGESVVMKRATQIWHPKLLAAGVPFKWVNFVHDEWQTECPRDMAVARLIAETQADAIRQVGVDLRLKCPMAGSILAGHGGLAIGDNWMETH